MVLFDEWFEWLVTESWASVVYLCRSICLHDCFVVNGRSTYVYNKYTFTARLLGC